MLVDQERHARVANRGLYLRNRVLMWAVLALAVTATNASAQVITNMVKRVGIGGSVGGIFTLDDDVNSGSGCSVSTSAWRRHARVRPDAWLGLVSGGSDLVRGVRRQRSRTSSRRPLMAGVGYTWVKDRVVGGLVHQRRHQLQLDPAERRVPEPSSALVLRPGSTRAIVSPSGPSSGPNTPLPGRSASLRAPGSSLRSSTTSSRRRWAGSRTSGTRAASTYSSG